MDRACFLITLVFIFLLTSCNNSNKPVYATDSFKKGETIYKTLCISCHNVDPRKDGILAPNIAGANYELIKSMIMTGKHPVGVEPKWPDAKMAPLPHLKEHIPDLHEYLKTFK